MTTLIELIEKMETVIYDKCGTTRWEDGSVSARDVARLLLAVVRDHAADPASWTAKHERIFMEFYDLNRLERPTEAFRRAIAAAHRAAIAQPKGA